MGALGDRSTRQGVLGGRVNDGGVRRPKARERQPPLPLRFRWRHNGKNGGREGPRALSNCGRKRRREREKGARG